MDTWIVIAAYNEEQRVAKTVQGVLKQGYTNVIVVDDGSRDNTFQEALQAGATVLRHAINRGQGAGLRTGVNYALENKAEYIIHYDADGQFHPEEIKDVLKPVQEGTADIALGSRFLGNANNISNAKTFTLKLGIYVTAIFSGIKLTDSHNGFRAMNRTTAKKIRITFDRMEHASEIIEEIATHKLKYTEVPVTVEYHEAGQSSWRSISMGIRLIAKKVIGW
jgi:glycosyltransferase involved in cell wall biosynthesis